LSGDHQKTPAVELDRRRFVTAMEAELYSVQDNVSVARDLEV
jgi:hypothetical protein